jgi:hypothetical protein
MFYLEPYRARTVLSDVVVLARLQYGVRGMHEGLSRCNDPSKRVRINHCLFSSSCACNVMLCDSVVVVQSHSARGLTQAVAMDLGQNRSC